MNTKHMTPRDRRLTKRLARRVRRRHRISLHELERRVAERLAAVWPLEDLR